MTNKRNDVMRELYIFAKKVLKADSPYTYRLLCLLVLQASDLPDLNSLSSGAQKFILRAKRAIDFKQRITPLRGEELPYSSDYLQDTEYAIECYKRTLTAQMESVMANDTISDASNVDASDTDDHNIDASSTNVSDIDDPSTDTSSDASNTDSSNTDDHNIDASSINDPSADTGSINASDGDAVNVNDPIYDFDTDASDTNASSSDDISKNAPLDVIKNYKNYLAEKENVPKSEAQTLFGNKITKQQAGNYQRQQEAHARIRRQFKQLEKSETIYSMRQLQKIMNADSRTIKKALRDGGIKGY